MDSRHLLQVLFCHHSPKGLWVKGGYPCAGYTFRRRRRGRAVPQWSAGVKPLKKPFLIPNPHWRRCPKAPAELAVWRLQACGALYKKAFVFGRVLVKQLNPTYGYDHRSDFFAMCIGYRKAHLCKGSCQRS